MSESNGKLSEPTVPVTKIPYSEYVVDVPPGESVVVGDHIEFRQKVFSAKTGGKFLGTRVVRAIILKDGYGKHANQHTYALEIIDSDGVNPLEPGQKISIKGRNLRRFSLKRKKRTDHPAKSAAYQVLQGVAKARYEGPARYIPGSGTD